MHSIWCIVKTKSERKRNNKMNTLKNVETFTMINVTGRVTWFWLDLYTFFFSFPFFDIRTDIWVSVWSLSWVVWFSMESKCNASHHILLQLLFSITKDKIPLNGGTSLYFFFSKMLIGIKGNIKADKSLSVWQNALFSKI